MHDESSHHGPFASAGRSPAGTRASSGMTGDVGAVGPEPSTFSERAMAPSVPAEVVERADTTDRLDRRVTRPSAAEWAAVVVIVVIGAVLTAVAARDMWYHADAWAYLTKRDTSIDG